MTMHHIKSIILSFTILLCMSRLALGYPSNIWHHIDSEHVRLSYNEKTAHMAQTALKQAEDMARNLGHYFGKDISSPKIAIVLNDHNDTSNGASYRYMPLITVECRKTEPFWRRPFTFKTLLSHEMAHTYTLRILQSQLLLSASMNVSAPLDGVRGAVQGAYQHNLLPIWFVEGLAQIGSYSVNADYRDPYREMLLRDAFLHDNLLSLSEMSRFEGTARDYELAYNQGFDLLLYLIRTYPKVKLKTVCRDIRKMGFKRGITHNYWATIDELYAKWLTSLTGRYSVIAYPVDGLRLYSLAKGPMPAEIRSADQGKYIIANWRHDYKRFDLMILDDTRKSIIQIEKNVGSMLKKDPVSGTIYFNRKMYNWDTGVSNYDIYTIDRKGDIGRVTSGKRCLAFDVKNNYLMYAGYKNGTTAVILKSPDGKSTLLKRFPYKTAVYSISMISENSAIVTLDNGKNITAALLSPAGCNILWQNLTFDVLDAVWAGGQRVVFVSTRDTTPQLYWCDLETDKDRWYQITRVVGGVRYPEVEQQAHFPHITCSVFENGALLRYRLNNPFRTAYPVSIINNHIGKDDFTKRRDLPPSPLKPPPVETGSNLIVSAPYFSVSFQGVKDSGASVAPGVQLSMMNAPENFEFGVDGGMTFLVDYQTDPDPFPVYTLWCKFALRQIRIQLEHKIDGVVSEGEYMALNGDNMMFYGISKTTFEDNRITAKLQLTEHSLLTAAYGIRENRLEEQTIIPSQNIDVNVDLGATYKASVAHLAWEYEITDSRFDPGKLGIPYFELSAGIDMFDNRYPALEGTPYYPFSYENNKVEHIKWAIEKRFLAENASYSVLFGIDGFLYNSSVHNNRLFGFMYTLIGNESMFSGYSPNIYATQAARFFSELRFNPFISVLDRTHWFERLHIGLKLEVGNIEYFSGIQDTATLSSIEGAIRYSFYLRPNSVSQVYVKYAMPLEDVEGIAQNPENRIYFGVRLQ